MQARGELLFPRITHPNRWAENEGKTELRSTFSSVNHSAHRVHWRQI